MRAALGLCALLLVACSGEDDGGNGMATEVGGECAFTPGSYVAKYRILNASPACGTVTPLPDEYLTVTDGGTLVGTAQTTAPGCVDSGFVTEGCFVAFDRDCINETAIGRLESNIGFQFEYADGTGLVTVTGRRYSGTTLIDTCIVNLDVTIGPR